MQHKVNEAPGTYLFNPSTCNYLEVTTGIENPSKHLQLQYFLL